MRKKNLQTTYENTYAAILTAKIFKIVMTIAAAFDMKIHQFDAINAFVNNKFDEKILCEWFEKFRESDKCWKLFRTLYDLKQILMLWYKKFISILKNLNLMSIFEINYLYVNNWLILFFYVDDIIVLSIKQNADKFQIFEKTLLMKFQMRIFEKLNWFLNIRIIRDRKSRKIWLCQNSYIEKIAAKFNVENFKNIAIFLIEFFKNSDDEIFVIDQTIYEYQQRVESLKFAAVIIKFDIVLITFRLFQFLKNFSKIHIIAINRVIFYFQYIKHLIIEYSKNSIFNIFICVSDLIFENDEMIRKNFDEFFFQLYENVIDWRTIKQITIITFNIETKLLTIFRTIKKIIWWKRFFESIKFDIDETLKIQCDNRQIIRIFIKKIMKFDIKFRHVDIHQHWLRQKMQSKKINVTWMSTTEMSANDLIKHLFKQKHEKFLKQLNLMNIINKLIK